MSITAVGNQSQMVTYTYSAGETYADLIPLIDAYIQARGATLYYSIALQRYVYYWLNDGGTLGNLTHCEFFELDYISVSNRIILRSWASWSGSAGISKAYNLAWTNTAGATGVGTEATISQPVDFINGGSLQLIAGNGYICVLGIIAGQTGNTASNMGNQIFTRQRFQASDILGSNSVSLYTSCGNLFINHGSPVNFLLWSSPNGLSGASNTSETAGIYGAGLQCRETFEVSAGSYFGGVSFYNTTQAAYNSQDTLTNKYPAGAVEAFVIPTSQGGTQKVYLGAVKNIIRKYNASVGDIINNNVDSYGVPTGQGGTPAIFYTLYGGLSVRIG